MPNKPDKFGIKFWLAADLDSKYMLNGFPYLGKDESRPATQSLGENVVLKLVEPFVGKGRNITTDNFFHLRPTRQRASDEEHQPGGHHQEKQKRAPTFSARESGAVQHQGAEKW